MVLLNTKTVVSQALVNLAAIRLVHGTDVKPCSIALFPRAIDRRSLDIAQTYFDQAIALKSNNARAYQLLGQMAAWQGDNHLALNYMLRSLAISSWDVLAVNWVGYLQDRSGDPAQAFRIWKENRSGPFLVTLGECLRKTGQGQAAERYYKVATDTLRFTPAFFKLEQFYESEGRPNEAVEAYAAVLTNTEDRTEQINAYMAIGKLYARLGDRQRAHLYFQSAFDLKPTASLANEIGFFLRTVRDFEGSNWWYQGWAKLEPNNSDPYRMLGMNAIELGTLNQAIGYLQVALQFGGPDRDVFFYMGDAHFRLGEFPQARDDLEKAAARGPKNVTILARLGETYEAMGDSTKALEVYQRILQLDPSNAQALSGLHRLKP
jgi:tetratricopeptide (TPR) repeat protein